MGVGGGDGVRGRVLSLDLRFNEIGGGQRKCCFEVMWYSTTK